ncbi:cell adhesion molecule CEACAM5-like [Brachyhypopomus gauderio]|uniref:cell adhesion molecule CEACAM5-like n=1 Tax=Brachyhypopomus gauderio TaxID=698409 RepID=UPI004043124F
MEFRRLSVMLLLVLLICSVQAEERPTAVVSIDPDPHVFVGETVTLTCEIKGGGDTKWQYSWMKDSSVSPISHEQVYTISGVAKSHKGKYTCTVAKTTGSRYSHTSDAVRLIVSARPKAMAFIDPDSHVFVGETVTLTCDIKGGGVSMWQYSWMKDSSVSPVSHEQVYTVNVVTKTNAGKYTCRGTFAGGSRYSHTSDAVTLTVSDKPKPTVSVSPQSSVYTGDTVILKCEVQPFVGWKFIWYRNNTPLTKWTSVYDHTNTISEKMSTVGRFMYDCGAKRRNLYMYYSNKVTITVTERPTAVVSIKPDPQVFVGETVTLTCDIKGGGATRWQYSWEKERSNSPVFHEQAYTISGAQQYHTGKYTCRGTEAGGSRYSHTSDAVTLTVSAVKPKPELTSSLQGAALIGNPVTLYCKLEQSAGWRFYWSKHTQNPENETSTETSSTTISSVMPSDGGQYWCRAGRGNPVYYTHYSDALWVNVTGVSSLVSLIISPNRSQHFSGHSLSLSCEDQSHSTAWTVLQYTQNRRVLDCSSGWGSVTGSTCTISSLSTSHTGVYWCQSESAGSNNPVNITVHDGDVILDSPVHPVTEGDSLTLRCLCSQTPSNLTVSFYKDGSPFQTQTTGQITIPAVSKSDEGLYYCKYPESRESPHSWISVRGSGSSDVPVGLIVGLCLTLLFIILLILLWSFKKNKGSGSPSPPTGHQQNTSQSCSGPGSSLSGPSLLQPGSDHVYANVGNRITADNTSTGPLDGTYALIELKNFRRHIKGKTSEASGSACVLYSELKQTSGL